MGRLLRNLIIVAIVVGVVIVALRGFSAQDGVTAQGNDQESLIQDETVVEVSDLDVTVNATGSIEPMRKVALAFELPSLPVEEVLIEAGQIVEQDDVLARLDSTDLEMSLRNAEIALEMQQVAYDALTAPSREEDIAVAEAALNAARASLNAAFAAGPDEYDRAIAEYQVELAKNALWQQQLQRDDLLNPPDPPPGVPRSSIPVLSETERERLENGLRQADYGVSVADAQSDAVANRGPDVAGLGSANASIVSAETQLNRLIDGPSDREVARAQIAIRQAELGMELAQTNFDRTVLQAPFDGVVAATNLTVGELPPAQNAVELVDASEFYVELAIDETEVVDIEVGQPVLLALDALPETQITGTITRVAQTPTRVGQVVTYAARVLVDPTLEPIRIGMNTTATIKVKELTDVLTLRNRFIRIDRATQQAFVTIQREDGRFEEVEVELGLRNETHSEIVSGLRAGQRVVLLPRDEANPFGGASQR